MYTYTFQAKDTKKWGPVECKGIKKNVANKTDNKATFKDLPLKVKKSIEKETV